MQDMLISLLGTGCLMTIVLPHIIGWKQTGQFILTVATKIRGYWLTAGEDASDY